MSELMWTVNGHLLAELIDEKKEPGQRPDYPFSDLDIPFY